MAAPVVSGAAGLADRLARLALVSVDRAVADLVHIAATHRCSQPQAAAHLEELAAAMAGLTVESVRTWPDPASVGWGGPAGVDPKAVGAGPGLLP